MPRTPTPPVQDFVICATAAIDRHRELNFPSDLPSSTRAELDALHAHLVSLHALLDAHAFRPGGCSSAPDNRLVTTAGHRIWQATAALHAAYHSTLRDLHLGGKEHRHGLPEGAPLLTTCQRHQRAAHLARRRMTPTDIARP